MTTNDIDIFERELEDRTKLCCALADKDAEIERLTVENAALRDAAGKVTCKRCSDFMPGRTYTEIWNSDEMIANDVPCPDCTPLRKLIGAEP